LKNNSKEKELLFLLDFYLKKFEFKFRFKLEYQDLENLDIKTSYIWNDKW